MQTGAHDDDLCKSKKHLNNFAQQCTIVDDDCVNVVMYVGMLVLVCLDLHIVHLNNKLDHDAYRNNQKKDMNDKEVP